jgi:hypothetical protein
VPPVDAPVPIPPPSKLAADPNMDDGEVPTVEHAVPLVALGVEMVPVAPVGTGLSPAELISVEPSAMPVGPTGVPGLSPSGEVAPRVGVVGIAPTCAIALLQTRSAGSITAINKNLTCALRFAAISRGRDYRASVNPHWRSMKIRDRKELLLSQGAKRYLSMRNRVSCAWLEGGRFAAPAQLNTRLLSWPVFLAPPQSSAGVRVVMNCS